MNKLRKILNKLCLKLKFYDFNNDLKGYILILSDEHGIEFQTRGLNNTEIQAILLAISDNVEKKHQEHKQKNNIVDITIN